MNKVLPVVFFVLSLTLSLGYYFSDFKQNQTLQAHEWQSSLIVNVDSWTKQLKDLKRVEIHSGWKYLPNNTYLKSSNLTMIYKDNHEPVEIQIMEKGSWEISDSYLLLTPTDFQDITANTNISASLLDAKQIKSLFKIGSQQSRRLDIINSNTLVLTNLGQSSITLFSRPSVITE